MDAITTYATLQAAVAGMAHRTGSTDITASVPLFIQLFEAEAYDELLLKDMESDEPLTLVVGQNFVPLPSGFIAPIAFWLVIGGQRVPLAPAMAHELAYNSSNSQPGAWAIDGPNVRFECPASSAFAARLRCRKKSSLSDANPTNYLLLKRPDVYLWGALKHLAIYEQDDANAQKYNGLCEIAKDALQDAESRHQALVPMRNDVSGSWGHKADIRRGY